MPWEADTRLDAGTLGNPTVSCNQLHGDEVIKSKACTKCGNIQESHCFQIVNGKPAGQCRACKTATEKLRRASAGIPIKKMSHLDGGMKLCVGCDTMKTIAEFSATDRGLGGVSCYCKVCMAGKARGSKKAAKTTAAYRARYPERHKAAHRVRMFEYRTSKKVTADGSVTDAFLKELYSKETCYYCKQPTDKDDRTADHRVSLIKGGWHTAENLVMACWTCNCSKQAMSEEDFINRVKNDNLSKNN
jgi:5-methylcytosine-specific restriction endonuclease McrA